MPRIGDDLETYNLAGNFSFTGARIAHLTATEYTLVDIEVDMTGSVGGFRSELIQMIEAAIDACAKSPRSDNLLVRVAAFSSAYAGGLMEVHGYKPLRDIDRSAYQKLQPGGMTPLYDACYVSIAGMSAYAKDLAAQDFLANGISFIITDGDDNDSTSRPPMIKAEVERAAREEHLESHVSVLIGINIADCRQKLEAFQREAGLTQFIDAGEATKGRLAKLAAFVSQSISSTSQAIGTGGPSQAIAAVI